MVNWGAERSFSAAVLCTGTTSEVTCLPRPGHVWEGNPLAHSGLAVKKSWVQVGSEPCSPLWHVSLSPPSSFVPSLEGQYLNILFEKKTKNKNKHRLLESRKGKEDRKNGKIFSFKSNHGGSATPQIYEKILTIHKHVSRASSVTEGFLTHISQLFKALGHRLTMRPRVPAEQPDYKIICDKTDPGMPLWDCHEKWMNNGKTYSSASSNLYKQYNFDMIRKFMEMVKLSIIESTQSKWLNW